MPAAGWIKEFKVKGAALWVRVDWTVRARQMPTDHRRAHRPGVQRKIDADPELQTFIRARIDRLTFTEMADEIAAHFPPARRVRRTAIHAWWKREKKRPLT